MSIFGDIMSAIFGRSARRAFSLNSAESLASSVRHRDENRTGSRGSEG
jgi:hypothetical protein